MSDTREALIKLLWRGQEPLQDFDGSAERVDFQGWGSTHPYLTQVLEEIMPTIVIEVGVWKGGSVITMADVVKRLQLDSAIIAVDSWLGSVEHWVVDAWFQSLKIESGYPTLYRTFSANMISRELVDIVVPLPLDSVNAAHLIKRHGIAADVLHIDAGHDFNSVISDLRNWWPVLRTGGVLIGDDYDPSGAYWPGVYKAFRHFFGDIEIKHHYGKCQILKTDRMPVEMGEQ